LPFLREAHRAWKEHVLRPLVQHLRSLVLGTIYDDRNGQLFVGSQLLELLRSVKEVDLHVADGSLFLQEFVGAIAEDTSAFYSSRSTEFLTQSSTCDFIHTAHRWIQAEEDRLRRLVPEDAHSTILNCVDQALIFHKLVRVHTLRARHGCQRSCTIAQHNHAHRSFSRITISSL
jgi:hypothetical protein